MSERIIQALLRLFAVFAKTEVDKSDKIKIVELFLANQLNKELAKKYLPSFEQEYDEVRNDISRITEKASLKEDLDAEKIKFKIEAKLSARIHKIGNSINEELTQRQKLYVVISLLEFISTDSRISDLDKEFMNALIDDLNLNHEEYEQLCDFILHPFLEIPDSENLMIINNRQETGEVLAKHIKSSHLNGTIKVFYLRASNLLLFRSFEVDEIFLNSQPIYENKVTILNIGNSIRSLQITPIYYSQILNVFNTGDSEEGVVLKANNITYKFRGGNIGLHELSINESSGNLIGIMGASGAGKSTLLNILNGNYKPTSGTVTINDIDLHKDVENKLNGLIGFVPQDDLLIKELTVYQNLFYSAKLCFDNLTEEEIAKRVDQVLQSLGLYERKDNVVGDELKKEISGGQRKRLNIALELIREPAILFLDEPTSGLSSKDSENIMDLLKELALKGKLVFVVIHQPSSDIFKTFDKLIILDTGGYQIYYGAPVDSIMYFKECTRMADRFISECHTCGNVNPEQIFKITEAKILDEDGTPMLDKKHQEIRKLSPEDWFELYQQKNKKEFEAKPIPKKLPEITFKIPNWFRQLKIFMVRDVLSKISNVQYMLINFLEAPIIAIFLAFIVKYWDVDEGTTIGYSVMNNDNIPVYIFMLVICAFFIGLTSSAEEIFRDQKIRSRESFLHLNWSSYLVSKIVILLVISAIQSLFFVFCANMILGLNCLFFKYWFMAFSVWGAANLIGLIISDSFNDIKTIYILVPFLVIPQIILSGIIVSFDKLNPVVSNPQSIPWYGEVITSRWAYEGLAVEQFSNNNYEAPFFNIDMRISECSYRKGEWSNQLNNKLNDCIRYKETNENEVQFKKNLILIANEIENELENTGTLFPFDEKYLEALRSENVNEETLFLAREHVSMVKDYYIKLNNKLRSQKDKMTYDAITSLGNQTCDELGIPSIERTPRLLDSLGNASFIELKKNYYNESLEEFCRNQNNLTVLIEYQGHLIQKTDPVFMKPSAPFVKAHFYAPMKPFFGNYLSTYWTNACVIWFMSICFYLLLYFRVLRKFLIYISNINFTKKTR